jgi:hypothetical protein
MNPIVPVQNTNNIRYANFVRITTPSATYRFATTPTALTIPAVDALPFSGLGQLVSVGSVQRDIKSTAAETTVTLVGIDTSMLALVLGAELKGSQIEMWHGFFDNNNDLISSSNVAWVNRNQEVVEWLNSSNNVIDWSSSSSQSGLYQFFNGYINSFSIAEQWMEEARSYVGVATVSASSVQLILQNRVAGRYTNNNSWQFYNSGDTSMNRVNYISTINYYFGKGAPATS